MKIIAPKNIFTSILLSTFSEKNNLEIVFRESALTCRELENNTQSIALIPTMDLLKHQHLYVSEKLSVSFDGNLSNSYLYFVESEHKPEKIYLRGDVSLNEIILSKILFSEKFSSGVEINLETSMPSTGDKNHIVVGDENFVRWNIEKGISLADEISDMLDLPYVNFVFASPDQDALKAFNKLSNQLDRNIEDQIEIILAKLDYGAEAKSLITNNLGSVYFEMTENETASINELIKLVYYHGIVDDMFDVKFV